MATKQLEIGMSCQEKRNWCWAAVAAAVRAFPPEIKPPGFDAQPAKTQCQIATEVLPGDCCSPATPCDFPFSLRAALADRCFQLVSGQMAFDDVKAELEQHSRPVAARIAWDPDGDKRAFFAHFVLIVGCDIRQGVPHLLVMDPDGGAVKLGAAVPVKSVAIPYADFCDAYELSGIWTHSYRVS